MLESRLILNERDARQARVTLGRVHETLSANSAIQSARAGLSSTLVERHRKAVAAIESDLTKALANYDQAKAGDFGPLVRDREHEPGMVLIVARIARGLSQADLADRLGLREQQIQRYEAERYRTISLSNYRRIATSLGVRLAATIIPDAKEWVGEAGAPLSKYADKDIRKVVTHARDNGWFDVPEAVTEHKNRLIDYLATATGQVADATFLRTGLVAQDLTSDLALLAWRARVTILAEAKLPDVRTQFDPLDISWLGELVRLSALPDGPVRARDLLLERGIVVVTEPQLQGLRLDGAAMVVGGTPVIALTLRLDRIDNFWFTLLHELAHIFLHHRSGLFVGFFDDFESADVDEIEKEANAFAGSALIPSEKWRLAPARISKDADPILDLAKTLGIHPAIIFGRIRNERNNFSIFSSELGGGKIRSLFF